MESSICDFQWNHIHTILDGISVWIQTVFIKNILEGLLNGFLVSFLEDFLQNIIEKDFSEDFFLENSLEDYFIVEFYEFSGEFLGGVHEIYIGGYPRGFLKQDFLKDFPKKFLEIHSINDSWRTFWRTSRKSLNTFLRHMAESLEDLISVDFRLLEELLRADIFKNFLKGFQEHSQFLQDFTEDFLKSFSEASNSIWSMLYLRHSWEHPGK